MKLLWVLILLVVWWAPIKGKSAVIAKLVITAIVALLVMFFSYPR